MQGTSHYHTVIACIAIPVSHLLLYILQMAVVGVCYSAIPVVGVSLYPPEVGTAALGTIFVPPVNFYHYNLSLGLHILLSVTSSGPRHGIQPGS